MKHLDKDLLKTNIENAAEYDFKNKKVFGSAYLVFQNNEIMYNNCFGNTSLNSGKPVTENTLFRLASMTKPITAIATLILIDRGLLSLNDSVSKFLPEFKNIHITQITDSGELIDLGEVKNDLTICNLLTHTSGIGDSIEKCKRMTAQDKISIDNTVKFYSTIGFDFEPSTKQSYSGTAAFDVLAKIIEKITNTDYLSFLKKEIFEPCDMINTTFIPSAKQWEELIDIHTKIDGENAIHKAKENCVFFNYPCTHFLGGAGLVSTLSDYFKFAKMLLNKGKTETKQLLSTETFGLMNTPYVSKELMPWDENWGLGVRIIVGENYKNLPVGTFGWSGAYGSHFWVDPENKIVAVFMKNSLFDGGCGNESARIFEKAVNNSFKN